MQMESMLAAFHSEMKMMKQAVQVRVRACCVNPAGAQVTAFPEAPPGRA